jgi:hypothetical protein
VKVSGINFTKIRSVGAELMFVDRQKDSEEMKKLITFFHEQAKGPKTCVTLKTLFVHHIWFPHAYLR